MNKSLTKAKKAKMDEFYTTIEDIEKELSNYEQKFSGKVIYCNCDDYRKSNFVKYFKQNFGRLGVKKMIAYGVPICDKNGSAFVYTIDKTGEYIEEVKGDQTSTPGDFRSDISIELLKESDIVVTNPPFSLFREYVAQLMEYEKQFLILGSLNAITYKEIFPLLKNNQIWLGCQSGSKTYVVPESFAKEFPNKITKQGNIYITKMGNTGWFTNIDHAKRHQILPLDLGFTYYGHEDMYPKYDNYDAINVDKVSQIPCDYEPCWYKCPKAAECEYAKTEGKVDKALCENSCNGELGVPITFMGKHCPEQFEIFGADFDLAKPINLADGKLGTGRFYADISRAEQSRAEQSKRLYSRIVIRKKKSVTESSESQSHSLTNTVQNSSELLDTNTTLMELESAELMSDNSKSQETVSINEFSFRKCNGVMGIPITFLDKYCPEQFEILGITQRNDDPYKIKKYMTDAYTNANDLNARACILVNGHPKSVYARILICRKQEDNIKMIKGEIK